MFWKDCSIWKKSVYVAYKIEYVTLQKKLKGGHVGALTFNFMYDFC